MDKENAPTTPRLATRKSYSILSPISSNIGSPSKDRKISESTGLAKFSLSPRRQLQTPTSLYSGGQRTPTSIPRDSKPHNDTIVRPRTEPRGLPVYIPIQYPEPNSNHQHKPKSDDSQTRNSHIQPQNTLNQDTQSQNPHNQVSSLDLQSELLGKYAAKHAELIVHEKEVERLKFELLEISTSLESSKRLEKLELLKLSSNEPVLHDIFKQIHHQTNQDLEKLTKSSEKLTKSTENPNDDLLPSINTLKTRASKIFTNDANVEREFQNLKKKASSIFTNDFSRPSTILSRNENNEISEFITQSNERFDVLSKKTSRFFTDVMTNLSPKKISQTTDEVFNNLASNIKKLNTNESKEDPANNSFNFDYLSSKQGLENPHIFEGQSSFIDDSDTNMNVIYEQAEDTSDVVDIDDYDSSFDN